MRSKAQGQYEATRAWLQSHTDEKVTTVASLLQYESAWQPALERILAIKAFSNLSVQTLNTSACKRHQSSIIGVSSVHLYLCTLAGTG